jgi:hypothetical protein
MKQNKEAFSIALSGAGRGLRRRDDGGVLINVQYKPNWNCQYASPHIMNIS